LREADLLLYFFDAALNNLGPLRRGLDLLMLLMSLFQADNLRGEPCWLFGRVLNVIFLPRDVLNVTVGIYSSEIKKSKNKKFTPHHTHHTTPINRSSTTS